jgi:hypothetical protein
MGYPCPRACKCSEERQQLLEVTARGLIRLLRDLEVDNRLRLLDLHLILNINNNSDSPCSSHNIRRIGFFFIHKIIIKSMLPHNKVIINQRSPLLY